MEHDRCRVCGETSSTRARFCPRCGARLAAPALGRDPVKPAAPEATDETVEPEG